MEEARFIICKASAGSGKTYTLVRQYIETAICAPDNYRFILAITFTNKAANGMKARIMETLSLIRDYATGAKIKNDDREKTERLITEIACHLDTEREEVYNRCIRLMSTIMHNYSHFSVLTIDSFVHRIVQSFAHDLRLPMNFDVMLDSDDIVKSTVDEMLLLTGQPENEMLTEVLCAFTEQNMQNDKSYKISKQIEELAVQIFREEAPKYLEKLKELTLKDFIDIQKSLVSQIKAFEKKLSESSQIAVNARKSKNLEVKDFPHGENGFFGYFEKFANGDYSNINETPKRVLGVFEGDDAMYAKSAPNNVKEAIEEISSEIIRSYEEIQKLLKNGRKEYNTWKLLETNIYGLALLGKITEIKEHYYSDNGLVHISEFNKRIYEQVMDEPTPFIYERIGGHYHNYLIDEFQDTSKLQWLNFLPLMDEAVGHDFNGIPAVGTQSMVVGDGKQAIYRFRQGNVEQFMMLPKVDSKIHGRLLEKFSKTIFLTTNYRTLSNIVYFNNHFFQWAVKNRFKGNKMIEELYWGDNENKHPSLWQYSNKDGGYIRISFCKKNKDGKKDTSLSSAILKCIQDQHKKGFKYSDIYILARTNDTLVEISNYIVENCGEQSIPMVSNESFILSNSQPVLFLQAILTYINNPQDRVAALRTANLAIQTGIIKDTVLPNEFLWQLKDNNFNIISLFAKYGIVMDLDNLSRMSIYDCCESLVRIFHLGDEDRANDAPYIATLLNMVAKYTQRNHGTLNDFLDYLEKKISKISTSASASEAVQMMTIHKAKGLEAPIIIYALKSERPKTSQMWTEVKDTSGTIKLSAAFVKQTTKETIFKEDFDKESLQCQMDDLNVFYVAMTRPEEKLLIFCEDVVTPNATDGISLLSEYMNSSEINDYLTDNEFQHTSLPDKVVEQHEENMRIFSFGEDFVAKQEIKNDEKNEIAKESLQLKTLDYPEWQSRIVISTPNASLLSTLEDNDSGEHHNKDFGILIHELLANIKSREDVNKTVENYCTANHLDDNISDELKRRIFDMINDPENARYFDPKYHVVCELPIVVGENTFRPDRVVFTKDETWVVDYKTGSYNPSTHKKYEQQVSHYVRLIADMGHPNVKGKVIYL